VDALSNKGLADSVSKAFAVSVRNNLIAEMAAQATRLIAIVILARSLLASDFGIFKALFAITAVVGMLCEGGLPDALIQRKDLDREHQCTAVWLSLGIILVAISVFFAIAPVIASLMKMPELNFAIRLMCVPLFFEGLSMTSAARLQRDMRFGAMAFADFMAEAAFLGAGIGILRFGLPRWSLIGALAARFIMHGLTILIASPPPLGLPRMRAIRDLQRFALTASGARMLQAFSDNAEFILIGRLLGEAPLGIYGMALDLLRFVPNRIYRVTGRVAYSAFCKLQDHRDELASSYLHFFETVGRIVLPLMFCEAIVAPDLIRVFYGPHWLAAAAPLRILAVGIAFVGMNVAISSLYFCKGHPELDAYFSMVRVIAIITAIVALRSTGFLAVIAGISVAEVLSAVFGQYLGQWFTGLTAVDLIKAAVPGIRLALFCGAATILEQVIAHYYAAAGMVPLAIAAILAGAVYLRLEAFNLRQMINEAFGRESQEPVSAVD
jgi:O-antigen/teichoic acid export membrane protein